MRSSRGERMGLLMTFSEKLSFLMDITKTTNSALSLYVSLDASYISRLRRGKRTAPRDDGNVRNMAVYFARHCKEDYQKKALGDALGLHPFPEDSFELSRAIACWLLSFKEDESSPVEHFLGEFALVQPSTVPSTNSEIDYPHKDISIYFGVEGKRQAVLFFLNEVASAEKPQTLLLFSDEETSWMTDDLHFARQWASLMMTVLAKGHQLKIIHTVSRDLDEMLSAISQWMPLYISGSIEPYFYPKKRDGIFRNTLFIAPGTAALVSGSVGNQTRRAANLLLRDPAAVKAYEELFLNYQSLCLPLMRIFSAKDSAAYLQNLAQFESENCKTIIKTESLSLLTLPEALFGQITERAGLFSPQLNVLLSARRESFRRSIEVEGFTEIISLPEPNEIVCGNVRLALSDILEPDTVFYTPSEYISHLRSISKLLLSCENYHVHITERHERDDFVVYAKEDRSVILVKISSPPVAILIKEGNMTAAFWDYLRSLIDDKLFEKLDNKAIAQRINKYIEELERTLSEL